MGSELSNLATRIRSKRTQHGVTGRIILAAKASDDTMTSTRARSFPPSIVARWVIAVIASAMIGLASFASADEGPPVPDPLELIDLVRNTILAVDAGNKTGNYDQLNAMGTARFQSENPSPKLAEQFANLKATGVDLSPIKDKVPMTTRPPTMDQNGLLRILGFFQMDNTRVVYDVVYDYDFKASEWQLSGVKLEPRELPPQPKLMQPQ